MRRGAARCPVIEVMGCCGFGVFLRSFDHCEYGVYLVRAAYKVLGLHAVGLLSELLRGAN